MNRIEFFKWIETFPKALNQKIRKAIRKRAIESAKARLIVERVNIDELSDEELEIIIKDEENKIIDTLKSRSIMALLALLGISLFG